MWSLFRHSRLPLTAVLPLLMGLATHPLGAMPPPTPEMLKEYKKDGSLKDRIAFAERIGNHRVKPGLALRAMQRLEQAAQRQGVSTPEKVGIQPTPPGPAGMPTKGTVKVLVIGIDFSDYPHSATNSTDYMTSRTFGDGGGAAAPYDSLHNFYARSSYDQLDIQGNFLGWYRPSYTRASMGTDPTDAQRENLIKEALLSYNTAGHDFAQYDNNDDGKIDYFAIVWTGPNNGWSNFWWGYQTGWWATPSPSLDGKVVSDYSWQWESYYSSTPPANRAFDPSTLIHETGHALGLPDYYDYKSSADGDTVGPDGGVGGLDQMDSKGDHNCFSKWLFDWITPQVYTTSATGLSLLASGNTKDNNAIIVMDTDPGSNFGEFFMVQNRHRVGNDTGLPADGLLIWHVDSRLNASGNNFAYNNSYTAHKLLRLMEADGLEEIERGIRGNAGDYWTNGKDFGPASSPNSNRYDGFVTKMGVKVTSAPGTSMTLNVYQVTDSTPPTGKPGTPTASTNLDALTFTWTQGTAADVESNIAGYHLQVGTTPGGHEVFDGPVGNVFTRTFTDFGHMDGVTLYARVAPLNGAAQEGAYSDNSQGAAVSLPILDGAVLNNTHLTFKTIGPWAPDATTSTAGPDSAKSAPIQDNARTYLQSKLTGPGTLTFDWRVSSEPPLNSTTFYDNLAISIDGVVQKRIGGETDWSGESYELTAGPHIVRWTYTKDQNTIGGSDAGWVDDVQWATQTGATATINPAAYTTVPGDTVAYSATVANFASNSNVNWTIDTSAGSFSPATTASGATTTFTAGTTTGNFTLTATPVETPSTPGTSSLVLVTPSSVAVTVNPGTSVALTGANVTLTSSVSLLTNGNVTWSTNGGSYSVESEQSATWASSLPGTYTLTATSQVATGRSGSATVTVIDPATINLVVSPVNTKTLLTSGTFTFTASGDQGGGVHWSVNGSATISTSGLLTLPSVSALTGGTFTVTATSKLDSSKTATATFTLKSMDLDGSGTVDAKDLLVMAQEWGLGTGAASNLLGVGTVDNTDLTALLAKL